MAKLPQSEIIYIIVFGTVAILILIGGIAAFLIVYQKRMLLEQERQKNREREYQQKMIEAQLVSQEIERKRIAADLHDSLGSLLWGAKLHAAFLERSITLEGETKKSYVELMNSLNLSVDTVKRIAWELTPEAFHSMGLTESLRSLCTRLDGKGIDVTFSTSGNESELNDSRALSIYRIVQELLSNGIKHSQASLIQVSLESHQDGILICVQDNGIGFKLEDKRTGVGWWNVQQRAKQLQAKTIIGNPPMGKGTQIQIVVPLAYEND